MQVIQDSIIASFHHHLPILWVGSQFQGLLLVFGENLNDLIAVPYPSCFLFARFSLCRFPASAPVRRGLGRSEVGLFLNLEVEDRRLAGTLKRVPRS